MDLGSSGLILDVNGVGVEVIRCVDHSGLDTFCDAHPRFEEDAKPNLRLVAQPAGLHLEWFQNNSKPLKYYIDVDGFTRRQKSYPAAKQGAFNQALGKKTKHVIDATAGWGRDALLMCAQAYQVTMLERSPIMALLLKDAMQRLGSTEWARNNSVSVPKVIQVDAIEYLLEKESSADCLYLDPMFPPKKKISAAVNKRLQLLQWLLGPDCDSEQLMMAGTQFPCQRIVVKRPDYADPLLTSPSQQFSSKLVHYDVYHVDHLQPERLQGYMLSGRE